MTFQNPALLYGLFALLIPIIIHFFNFRKTRKVYFSNTRFLRKVKESEATRKRLKHYLILASRLLFLFFLIIAFAQPFLPSEEEHAAGLPVTIYLDNSFSMSNEVEEGVSALNRGISHMDELIALMPSTTEYRLLTNEFRGNSRILQSKRELEEALTELEFTSIPRTAEEVIGRLNADIDEEEVNLFWVGDFQASTAGTSESLLDSSYQVNLVPMQFSNLSNVYIDSLFVTNPIMITDERVELHVVFRNIGPSTINELIAKVYVDGVQSGTASVNLDPNGRKELVFDLSVSRSEAHACKIIFEEFPVTFDNEFNFVINVPEKIRVLEIRQTEGSTPISLVFANESLFDLTSQQVSNLDYNQILLSDVVIVNELDALDPTLATALGRYESGGGTIVIVPSENMGEDTFLGLPSAGPVILDDSAAVLGLSTPDFDNPFFQNVFEEKAERIQMPSARKFVQWQGNTQPLLEFASGGSFLVSRQLNGMTYLLSSSLRESSGNFARHAIFVPVMYKIAAQAQSQSTDLYKYTSETGFAYRHDSSSLNDLYALVRDDQRIIPEQRIDGNRVYFSLPRFTISPGFYELYYGDRKKGLMAFNIQSDESDIRQVDARNIPDFFSGARIKTVETESEAQFASTVSGRYVGIPLWREALMLALLFFLVEVLLVRFMP